MTKIGHRQHGLLQDPPPSLGLKAKQTLNILSIQIPVPFLVPHIISVPGGQLCGGLDVWKWSMCRQRPPGGNSSIRASD